MSCPLNILAEEKQVHGSLTVLLKLWVRRMMACGCLL
uniref:Uncharacterized protein n=1 Tax=Rhizophora mucronata TaxID=61149 RepID=A0A2P2L627_RHIMU